MSKPFARVVFSALIAIVLIAGIYSTVMAGAKSGRAGASAGVNLVPNRDRTTVGELQSLGTQSEPQQGLEAQRGPSDKSGHDCNDESWVDPDD